MININTIQDYNNMLINNLDKVNLEEYFKFIINNIYKNLDLTCMNYFLELCNYEDEFYVEHIKLQDKYNLNNLKFICGIQKYNNTKLNKYNENYNIIRREYNANPIQLYLLFKEEIKIDYKQKKIY
jgi:hypothetical protein